MQSSQPSTKSFASGIELITRQVFPWLFWVMSAAPLVMLMGLGVFTRYLADDYSTSSVLKKVGFWNAQSYWYQSWSGRYSFTFLITLVETAGVMVVPWLPMISMLVLITALIWTFRQLFLALGIELRLIWTAVLAHIILFATIKSFHEFSHVIFWQTGILTYQISIIFIIIAIGVFINRHILAAEKKQPRWEVYLWCLLFFIGGGFSETWVVIQISLLGLAFICFFFSKVPKRKAILWILAGGFVFSWLALFVMAAAPGNLNRDTVTAELSIDLLCTSLINAFWDVPRFLFEWVSGNNLLAAMLLVIGLTAGLFTNSDGTKTRRNIGFGALLFLCAYILMWAGFVPQFAVMGIRPAERALFMPMFLLLWVYVLFGLFLGVCLRVIIKPALLTAAHIGLLLVLTYMMVWLPLRFTQAYYNLAGPLSMYALRWDERDTFLRQAADAGRTKVVAESLRRNPELHALQSTFWIEGDLQDLPDNWINQEAARYYGLDSIALKYPVKSNP